MIATAAAPPTPSEPEADDQITLRLRRPAAGQVVIDVGGEVDMLTSPQLRTAVLEQFAADAGVELVVLALDDVGAGYAGLAALAGVVQPGQGVPGLGQLDVVLGPTLLHAGQGPGQDGARVLVDEGRAGRGAATGSGGGHRWHVRAIGSKTRVRSPDEMLR